MFAPFVPGASRAPPIRLRLDATTPKPSDPWATPFGRFVAGLDDTPDDAALLDHARATLGEVREVLGAKLGESTGDAARRVATLASEREEALRCRVGEADEDVARARVIPRRRLVPALRAEVRRREAEGVVPATRAEVVGADLELAAATPEEQASASIRLCEEREGRRLTAAELGARFAPTYAWIRALAALIAARAEAERRAAGGRGPTIDLDEIEVGEGRR
jgi:hypothetical protein